MEKKGMGLLKLAKDSMDLSEEVEDVILRYAERMGQKAEYVSYQLPGVFYVELPEFIQRLWDYGLYQEAESCLEDCFSKGRIPVKWWKKMQRKE